MNGAERTATSTRIPVRVGVLALQGGVREHAVILEGLGAEVVLVRRAEQLPGADALVLPGGESSAIDRRDEAVVGVRPGAVTALASHPELSGVTAWHQELVEQARQRTAGTSRT